MPLSIAGSLILALLLSQNLRGMTAYRTLFYLPTFTSGVALIILWKALYNPDFGPINAIISFFGITPPQWLTSTHNLLGLAGAFLSTIRVHQFVENMTNGIGFLALAIVIFGRWSAPGIVGAALFFGLVRAGADQLQLSPHIQQSTAKLLNILPYALSIIALATVTARSRAPAALGQAYVRA